MNRWGRIALTFFAFLAVISSLLLILAMLSRSILNSLITVLVTTASESGSRLTLLLLCLFIAITGLITLSYAVLGARMRRAHIQETNLGNIDVSTDALESIALNATKAAQAGVKSARSRITATKDSKLCIYLSVMTYPDVELPAMMNKVQERVRKDIERYTGIEVAEVQVKVASVEAIAARVER